MTHILFGVVLSWWIFVQVLSDTIARDLKEANKLMIAKGSELRQERLNLISVKIKEELHQDVTLEARDG